MNLAIRFHKHAIFAITVNPINAQLEIKNSIFGLINGMPRQVGMSMSVLHTPSYDNNTEFIFDSFLLEHTYLP